MFALMAALVAGLIVALLHTPGGRSPRETGTRAELRPREPQFGDTVVATLAVPASSALHGKVDFSPYSVVSKTSTRSDGRAVTTYRLRCLEQACVPHGKDKVFRFKPAVWPVLRVHSRVTKADAEHPLMRVPPPVAAPARYRISPTTTAIALFVLAALLAAGGAFLLLRVALRRTHRRVPPLELLLSELAASSANGSTGRRRRALEALAHELEPLDASLSAESRVLAWAPRDPQAATIADLTDRVRTVMKP